MPKMNARFSSLGFACASLGPANILALGALLGGGWPYAGLFCITLLVLLLDRTEIGEMASADQAEWLPRAVGFAHFVLLGLGLWAVGATGHLDTSQKIALVAGLGLYFGQVSNACAHELIHRGDRSMRALGTAIYCSLLNGQHVSAHMLVHHVHAGTARDPNSAPLGRGFWRFFGRAVVDEFTAGLQAENQRRKGRARGPHPYVVYLGGAAASLLVAFLLGGGLAVVVLLILALHAQMQLMLSDYLQHYGLRRASDASGRAEPMRAHHSWNAPRGFSAALMLNAPLHSDHHMNPSRPFSELRFDAEAMPTLPRSVPVMGALALVPPLWRRVMDPRVHMYQAKAQEAHGNVMPKTTLQAGSQASGLSE
ncbi:alkane 1-monooxygenase [uncultured Roseobacter sp.]|uniref:alkane 1-monooxygenase n=1 Tax=uncultured Roseobacter sp. TaxID=114847 RepID=UPI00262B8140|nr:alkane 1-monooxygenase [uncultured Roseobacter sp.]